MKKKIYLFLIFIQYLHANQYIPNNFEISRNKKAVFVDFQKATSTLVYDYENKTVYAETIINFEQSTPGYPIFDLVPKIDEVLLNGDVVNALQTTMLSTSKVLYIDKLNSAGAHTLFVKNKISKNLKFTRGHIQNAFWMSDLTDRKYLEQYLPTNLEYDQYESSIQVKITGTTIAHEIFTNGDITELGTNVFRINFPRYFTSSSYYFHLTKKDLFKTDKFIFKSIDGRDIPVVIYSKNGLDPYKTNTISILKELEKDYGRWPHSSVVIYGAGRGGMEHCGATITSLSALGHELTHSYFARGVMPAHGNSGWIDEAIASWRDAGYPNFTERQLTIDNLGGHSPYQRTTDRGAYGNGMRFLGHLDLFFKDQESFKVFLKYFHTKYNHRIITNEHFLESINQYYGNVPIELFDKYIFSTKSKPSNYEREDPHHPILSSQELLDLL